MFSYAQNFEDVMLARCFSNQTTGFYIDVGANDPVVDSVTKYFYDLGWCGINVEPMESFFQKLCNERPRDINLNCAASFFDGEINFYEIENTGLSSVVEASSVNAQQRGFDSKQLTVESKKLDSIILEHNVTSIDFLKVDVEGFEGSVLAGFNFIIRPKIIVIEINKPLETNIQDLDWEPKLLENGYVKAYYDGLNNFYVDIGYIELFTPCLAVPPNVFDFDDLVIATGYIRSEINRLHQECANRDSEMNRLHQECANRDSEMNRLHQECANRDSEMNRLHQECANQDNEINILTNELSSVANELSTINIELSDEKNEVNRLHSEVNLRDNEINRLHNHIHSICNTLSWKITKPIRLVKVIIKKILLIPKKLILKIKQVIKVMILKIAKKIATIDIVRRIGKSYLNKHPELKIKIKRKMVEKGLWHDPYMPIASFPLVNSSYSDMNVEQVRQRYGNDVANVYQILTKKK